MTFGDFRITNQRHCVLQMLLMIIFPFASSFPLSYWTHNSWPAFIASRNHQPFGTALYYAKKKTKESSNAAAIHNKIQGEIQSLNNNGTSLDVNNPTQVFQAVFEEQQQEAMACLLQLVVTNKIPFSMTSDQKKMAGFILDCIRMEEGRPKTIIKEPPQQDPTQCDNTNHWKIGIQAYFDGAAGPKKNPNVGGTGVVLECCAWSTTSAAEEIFREKILIQEFLDKKVNTPHQAEYSGVILALEEAMKMITLLQQKCNINQEDDYHLAFVCRGNSHLVIQQMKGKRQCRSANVKPFYTKAQKLLQKIMGATATTDITFEHIPHRYNLIADGLAKEAIKTRQSLIVVENEDDDERLTPSLATKSTQGVEILQSNNSSTTEEQNTDSVSTKASDRGKEVKSSGASISLSANSAHANIDILCEILFDGGSRGNPGVGGAGAQVQCVWMLAEGENEVSSQERKVQIRTYLEKGITNNQAEYWGVISGLQEALNIVKECKHRYQIENPNDCHVTLLVQGDSKLVINQLCGLYRCKSENLKALFAEAKKLVLDLDQLSTLDASFEHILRSYNYVADGLANEAMDSRRSWSKTVDHCRLCPENRKRKV